MTDYKITLCGDYSVGKTALVTRLFQNVFCDHAQSTIGAAFKCWRPRLSDTKLNTGFGIWDTAGQERFHSLLPMYFRGSNAILYCCDSTKKFNQKLAENTYKRAVKDSDALIYIVLTKVDSMTSSNDTFQSLCLFPEESEFADENNCKLFCTSSLTGKGVQELFLQVAYDVVETYGKPIPKTTLRLNEPISSNKLRRGCCPKHF